MYILIILSLYSKKIMIIGVFITDIMEKMS